MSDFKLIPNSRLSWGFIVQKLESSDVLDGKAIRFEAADSSPHLKVVVRTGADAVVTT